MILLANYFQSVKEPLRIAFLAQIANAGRLYPLIQRHVLREIEFANSIADNGSTYRLAARKRGRVSKG